MAKKAKAKAAEPEEMKIVIPAINYKYATITIEGTSPLLVHKFSEKSKTEIKEKQAKAAKVAKAARDPEAEFETSLYRLKNGKYGIPASGLKLCAISACRFIDGVPMTLARGAFHVFEEEAGLVPIKTPGPVMDERMVRIGGFGKKVATPRYRARFDKWEITFKIQYNANIISPEQIANLYEHAGFSVGLCEYRPEKNGNLGLFKIKRS